MGTEGRGEHRLLRHEIMHHILVDEELAFLIQLDNWTYNQNLCFSITE